MKKILLVVTLVSLISLISIGVVLAQDNTPETPDYPYRYHGMGGGGWMYEYMHTAMADALGIDLEDYESRMAAGQTLYDIAEELGIDLDTLAELHTQARQDALEMAFEDGAITEEDYQFFQERIEQNDGFGYGGMRGFGGGYGRGRHGGGFMHDQNFSGGPGFHGDCHGGTYDQTPQN